MWIITQSQHISEDLRRRNVKIHEAGNGHIHFWRPGCPSVHNKRNWGHLKLTSLCSSIRSKKNIEQWCSWRDKVEETTHYKWMSHTLWVLSTCLWTDETICDSFGRHSVCLEVVVFLTFLFQVSWHIIHQNKRQWFQRLGVISGDDPHRS